MTRCVGCSCRDIVETDVVGEESKSPGCVPVIPFVSLLGGPEELELQ